MSQSERSRRIGLNESVFRSVNESLSRLPEETGRERHGLDLICECGHASCVERIRIGRDAYERLRADPLQFALVPGHEIPEVERVVERHSAYAVVRKVDEDARRMAAGADLRTG
jgi:hypothetical protein